MGSTSPLAFRTSDAPSVNVTAARDTSPRENRIGLPLSRVMSVASSSARASISCAVRSRIAARLWLGIRRVSANDATAAAMASFASLMSPTHTSPTIVPSYGLVMASASPESRSSAPMRSA